MIFETKVAFRFLKDGKTQSIMILSGISIGVAILIFLSSLITSLQNDLINKTVGDAPHITVKPQNQDIKDIEIIKDGYVNSLISSANDKDKTIKEYEKYVNEIRKNTNISAVSGFADGPGFISKGKKTYPILIRGMDFENANKIYNISNKMLLGYPRVENEGILLGKTLADKLGLEVNSNVTIKNSIGSEVVFKVSGIFDFKNQNINDTWAIVDISKAQSFLGIKGDVTSIEIQARDYSNADILAKQFNKIYSDINFKAWQETNAQLLSALKSQSGSSNVIQIFVLLAVALGISSVLAVSVMQKSKQIGILKAMGATNKTISTIFIIQGGILGFVGSIVGSIIGFALVFMFTAVSLSSPDALKIKLTLDVFITSIIISTFVGMLAALIPARNSSKLNPIEVIRNG